MFATCRLLCKDCEIEVWVVLYKDFTVRLSLRYNLTFSKVEGATQNYMLPYCLSSFEATKSTLEFCTDSTYWSYEVTLPLSLVTLPNLLFTSRRHFHLKSGFLSMLLTTAHTTKTRSLCSCHNFHSTTKLRCLLSIKLRFLGQLTSWQVSCCDIWWTVNSTSNYACLQFDLDQRNFLPLFRNSFTAFMPKG